MSPDAPRSDQETAAHLARVLAEEHYGAGPLAELRRLDPAGSLVGPALQRLLVRYVESSDPARLRLWALFIHCIALLTPQQGEAQTLGCSLFDAGYKEGRMSRLLATRADEMAVAVPRMVRFLSAKGGTVRPGSLWDFLDATMTPATSARRADDARTRLARDYYQAEDRFLRPAPKGAAA